MTPHEKAVNAINARLERLQANLRETRGEDAQRVLLRSLVVTIGVAEALNDYIRTVGRYAQRRHGQLKQANEALGARHAELLDSGKALLEKLKANPADRTLRKEIELAQQSMTAVQKSVRRGANTLQRELAPCLAMIDQMATSVRCFAEADRKDELKRLLKAVAGQVRELYGAHPSLPADNLIDAEAWESSGAAEIEGGADFYVGYAHAGYQTTLALEFATMALSEVPPRTAEEAAGRAADALAVRLREVAARL
ncbi:MAG: hypothetical protein ACRD27_03110 [Terracidiphilus sp.]